MTLGLFFYDMRVRDRQPEFKPHIERFETLYGKSINTEITFVPEFKDGVVGICYFLKNKVEISREYWNRASDLQKELLVFHELGHCVLHYYGHNEQWIIRDKEAIPNSIMYPYLISDKIYERHKGYYINELFNR